ncbi:hypothetical protein [Sphingomonas sanguinis]|uniref:hypothetical protein n=1 Tax=Sphingomonas sanguinis TaxID=33051 RepID=UPI000735EE27|nr:hypothetical protein [Sphingomonas sanguinis]
MTRSWLKVLVPVLVLSGCGAPAEQAGANDTAVNAVDLNDAPAAIVNAGSEAPVPAATNATEQTAPTIDRTNQTGAKLYREILLDGGKLGDAPITDFRLDDRCTTSIVTAGGSTTVDWSKVSNVLSRTSAGRHVLTIERDGQPVELSIPEKGDTPKGNAALQLESGFGLLASECQS